MADSSMGGEALAFSKFVAAATLLASVIPSFLCNARQSRGMRGIFGEVTYSGNCCKSSLQ
jgi:hypothetical protein